MDCNLVFPFNLDRWMEKFHQLSDSGCWDSLSRHLENVRLFSLAHLAELAINAANGNWS